MPDPLAGYTPDWRTRRRVSSADPLAGYTPDWRTRTVPDTSTLSLNEEPDITIGTEDVGAQMGPPSPRRPQASTGPFLSARELQAAASSFEPIAPTFGEPVIPRRPQEDTSRLPTIPEARAAAQAEGRPFRLGSPTGEETVISQERARELDKTPEERRIDALREAGLPSYWGSDQGQQAVVKGTANILGKALAYGAHGLAAIAPETSADVVEGWAKKVEDFNRRQQEAQALSQEAMGYSPLESAAHNLATGVVEATPEFIAGAGAAGALARGLGAGARLIPGVARASDAAAKALAASRVARPLSSIGRLASEANAAGGGMVAADVGNRIATGTPVAPADIEEAYKQGLELGAGFGAAGLVGRGAVAGAKWMVRPGNEMLAQRAAQMARNAAVLDGSVPAPEYGGTDISSRAVADRERGPWLQRVDNEALAGAQAGVTARSRANAAEGQKIAELGTLLEQEQSRQVGKVRDVVAQSREAQQLRENPPLTPNQQAVRDFNTRVADAQVEAAAQRRMEANAAMARERTEANRQALREAIQAHTEAINAAQAARVVRPAERAPAELPGPSTQDVNEGYEAVGGKDRHDALNEFRDVVLANTGTTLTAEEILVQATPTMRMLEAEQPGLLAEHLALVRRAEAAKRARLQAAAESQVLREGGPTPILDTGEGGPRGRAGEQVPGVRPVDDLGAAERAARGPGMDTGPGAGGAVGDLRVGASEGDILAAPEPPPVAPAATGPAQSVITPYKPSAAQMAAEDALARLTEDQLPVTALRYGPEPTDIFTLPGRQTHTMLSEALLKAQPDRFSGAGITTKLVDKQTGFKVQDGFEVWDDPQAKAGRSFIPRPELPSYFGKKLGIPEIPMTSEEVRAIWREAQRIQRLRAAQAPPPAGGTLSGPESTSPVEPAGFASTEVLSPLAGAGVGAAYGAATNEEHPIQGALAGALVGGALGHAVMRAGGELPGLQTKNVGALESQIERGAFNPWEAHSDGAYGFTKVPAAAARNAAAEERLITDVYHEIARDPVLGKGMRQDVAGPSVGWYMQKTNPTYHLGFEKLPRATQRARASAVGLATGQDEVLIAWPKAKGDAPMKSDGLTGLTGGVILTGKDEGPLSPEAVTRFLEAFGKDQEAISGAMYDRESGHLLFLNLRRYTGMSDKQFAEAIGDAWQRLGSGEAGAKLNVDRYYVESHRGNAALAANIGKDPVTLRATRDLLDRVQPHYEAYNGALGGDAAFTAERIGRARAGIDALARGVERPAPLGLSGKKGRIPVEEAGARLAAKYGPLPEGVEVGPELHARVNRMIAEGEQTLQRTAEEMAAFYTAGNKDVRAILEFVIPSLRGEADHTVAQVTRAILSQGNQVADEIRAMFIALENYKRTNRLSLFVNPEYRHIGGKKAASGELVSGLGGERIKMNRKSNIWEEQLAKLDVLLDALGVSGAADALLSNIQITGKNARREIATLLTFGPKIGEYINSIKGIITGQGVQDMWGARAYYFLQGLEQPMKKESFPVTEMVNGKRVKRTATRMVLDDSVTPEMRRVLNDLQNRIAAERGITVPEAQSLMWNMTKAAYRAAGAVEKAAAYMSPAQAAVDAVLVPRTSSATTGGFGKNVRRSVAEPGWNVPEGFNTSAKKMGLSVTPQQGPWTARTVGIQPPAPTPVTREFGVPGGFAASDLMLPVAGTGLGAAAGAALDPEHPVRGAVIGGAVGLSLGAGATSLLRSVKPPTLPAAGRAAVRRVQKGIDFTGDLARAQDRVARPFSIARLYQQVKNVLEPIERIGTAVEGRLPPTRNPKYLTSYVKSSDRTIKSFLYDGIMDAQTREIVGPSAQAMFAPLGTNPEYVRRALTFVKAVRDVGRGLEGLGGNEAMFADAQATVNALGADPVLQRFARDWEAFVDGVGKYAVDSGMWTPEQWAAMKASDALYVPYNRIVKDLEAFGKPGGNRPANRLVNQTGGVKKFKGSQRAVANLAESLVGYTDRIIRAADRYRVGASLFDVQAEFPDLITVVPASQGARAQAIGLAQVAHDLRLGNGDVTALDDLIRRPSKDHPVIWRNGPEGREYAFVNSPEVWEAVQGMSPVEPNALRMLLNVTLKPVKRVFVASTTGWAPRFIGVTNPARDIPDALGKSQHGMTPLDIAVGYAEAIAGTTGVERFAREMERNGLGAVSLYEHPANPAAAARQMAPTSVGQKARGALRTANVPLRAVERMGQASDQGARLAEARAAIRAKQHLVANGTWTPADLRLYAATKGRGATLDFANRPGSEILHLAADYLPFFGPAIQGPLRWAEAWRGASATRMVALTTATALTATVAWAMKHRSAAVLAKTNDRPSSERAGFFLFPMDDNGDLTIRIPMAQEQGVIAAAVTAGLDTLFDQDPNGMKVFASALVRALPPGVSDVVQGDLPLPVPGVEQVLENIANKRRFTQSPVVPERLMTLPPEKRRLDTTAPTFDVIAAGVRKLPGLGQVSPLQVENVARGLTSSMTPYVTDVTDPIARTILGEKAPPEIPVPTRRSPNNPLSAVIAATPPSRTESENQFYRLRDQVDEAAAGYADAIKRRDRADVDQYRPLARLKPWFEARLERLGAFQERSQRIRAMLAKGSLTEERARALLDENEVKQQQFIRDQMRQVPRH